MKKIKSILIVGLLFLLACQKSEKGNISLVGDLYAKNVVGLPLDFQNGKENLEYIWYIGASPTREWNQLPGIWTNEIVLLTSYVGNYIKCEITYNDQDSDKKLTASVMSSAPVEYKGNANTDWFKDAGFGVMVHYLK